MVEQINGFEVTEGHILKSVLPGEIIYRGGNIMVSRGPAPHYQMKRQQ